MSKENLCLCGCFQLVRNMFVHGHNKPVLGGFVMHSLATRQKMSQSRIGRVFSKETRSKMSQAQMGKVMSEEARLKMSLSRSMPLGSKHIISDGYVMIKTVDGWRAEHRVVMEKKLGRKLTSNEIPHHKDEDKANNRIKNLRLMTRSKHTKLHRLPIYILCE